MNDNITDMLETLETWGVEVIDDNTGLKMEGAERYNIHGITFRLVEDTDVSLGLKAVDADDVEIALTAFIDECWSVINHMHSEEPGAAHMLIAYGEVMGDTTWKDLDGREAAGSYLGNLKEHGTAARVWAAYYADLYADELPERFERYAMVLAEAVAEDSPGEFFEAHGLVFLAA